MPTTDGWANQLYVILFSTEKKLQDGKLQ